MLKTLFAVAFGALTSLTAVAQTAAPKTAPNKVLDDKFGFRDLKFETDTTAIEGLTAVERKGQRTVYTRATDNPKIGKATLSKIQYVFFNGQLMEVTLLTKGMLNSRNLRETLEESYGKGSAFNETTPNRFWDGKLVKMTYDEDGTFNGRTRLYHRKLYEQYQESLKAEKKKISADL